MKLRALFAIAVLAAALPALAATSCPMPQVLVGTNCTLLTGIGWAIAGLGTDSVFTIYVPPNVTGHVNHIAALSSSLGSAYTGYFGIKIPDREAPGGQLIITLADVLAGLDIGDVSPREVPQFSVTQVCWDPTCTAAAPAGAIPNMFSIQIVLSSPNSADINTNFVQMVVRFLNGSQVTYETQETAIQANAPFSIIPGVNLGATPAGRYVFNGAVGYLVVGRFPGDPLGLLPSTTVLPAGSDGTFQGILEVGMNGLAA